MRAPVLIVLLAVPLLELALLIKLGAAIGFWLTIAIIAGTAVAGVLVVRSQGLASLREASDVLRHDRPPVEPVLDGALRLLAGILLVTPGVLMDVAGVLLLVPPLRRWLARWIFSHAAGSASVRVEVVRKGGVGEREWPIGPDVDQRTPRGEPGPVIEGEFERIEEKTVDRQPPKRRPESGG